MAKVGVPSNKKIFEAVQELLGEKIFLPKGVFFIPFRGHELIVARVEEIVSLTMEGFIDLSFVTIDHFEEAGGSTKSILATALSEDCLCEMSIVTANEDFFSIDAKEVFLEFGRKNRRKAVVASRFPKITKNYLRCKGWNLWEEQFFPEIKRISGAEELSVLLGTVDFAVARIESGETLKINNLLVIEKIMYSWLIMVRHENFSESKAWKVHHALIKPKPLPSWVYTSGEHESIH